jgi:hypothetical protein
MKVYVSGNPNDLDTVKGKVFLFGHIPVSNNMNDMENCEKILMINGWEEIPESITERQLAVDLGIGMETYVNKYPI